MTAFGVLEALDRDQRFEVCRRIADRLSARMGAALTLCRQQGVDVPGRGLIREIMTNPLVFALPYGSLNPQNGLADVAGMLDNPIDGKMLGQMFRVVEVASSGIRSRVAKRKGSPLDNLLHHLTASSSAAAVLMDPVTGPAVVRSLSSLVGVKDLQEAGLDARVSKAMLADSALRPMASAWGELVGPVRAWGLISALASLVEPIWSEPNGWQVQGVHRPPAAKWSLRLPRSQVVEHSVVAVRFVELVAAAQIHGQGARPALKACWAKMVAKHPGVVDAWVADTAVAVFADPAEAVRFSESVHSELPGAEGIIRDPSTGAEFAVAPDMRVGVGLAWGRVDGGTDGALTWLNGPAVGEAVALAGRGSPSLRANDPLSIRRVAGQPDGLHSDGIVASGPFIACLQSCIAHPIHLFGSSEEVGGIADDFRFYPVPYWWEDGSRVWMWLELNGRGSAGPAELAVFNRVMFRDIHSRDLALERSDISAESVSGAGKMPVSDEPDVGPAWNPFDALDRSESRDAGTTDPWAQLDAGPEVEIDDE